MSMNINLSRWSMMMVMMSDFQEIPKLYQIMKHISMKYILFELTKCDINLSIIICKYIYEFSAEHELQKDVT